MSVAAAATSVTDGVADAEAARDAAQAAVGSVAVSAADTTSGKLSVKLEAGRGLETAIEDAGGNETLRFDITPQLNAGALLALAQAFI